MKKFAFFFAGILYLGLGIPPTQMLRWAGIVYNCYATEVYFFETKWGTANYPYGIAVDNFGNVYVTEYDRVKKFSPTGTLLTQWGSYGSGDRQFNFP